MIGIAEDDLGVDFFNQLFRGESLDRPLRPDRHEDRRFYRTVSGVEDARARTRRRTLGSDLKTHAFSVTLGLTVTHE